MNRDTTQGHWKQFKGKMQVQWGRLTGDYLCVITGRCTQIAGERQCAYGVILPKILMGKKTSRYPASNPSPNPARVSAISSQSSVVAIPTHESH